MRSLRLVAPYVGAWIETFIRQTFKIVSLSHPMWVRGLKHLFGQQGAAISLSHPMWVRGLKLINLISVIVRHQSHPMWVRGLKLETLWRLLKTTNVAPYVGAWIETASEIC